VDGGGRGLNEPERTAAGPDSRACLRAVTGGRDLTAVEAEGLFGEIMDGRVSPIMIAALLAALRTKGETAQEIAGAARVMRSRSTPVATTRAPLVDTCGTGGDFSGTFNISTTAGFVVAAAGVAVAKHGNRAASSKCGSADVLEALGAVIDLGPRAVGRSLDATGLGFLFAPRFHPAMRHAIGARREVGIRTIFNFLGPLTNPAGATRQVIGVPTPDAVGLVAEALRELGTEHALVVHGREGLDEISVTGPTVIAEVRPSGVETSEIEPADLGLEVHPAERLAGGDADENARILRAVTAGAGTPAQTASVAANAGAAIYVGGGASSLAEGVARALDLLGEGAPREVAESFVETTRRLAGENGEREDDGARAGT